VVAVVILMILTWRRTIDSDALQESSIYNFSIYLILYFLLALPPIVSPTQYLCNTF
jgi:hypothetical protein